MIYAEKTLDFIVEVEPRYIQEHSQPDQSKYFFSYTITINNVSSQKAQLLRRHWIIVDGHKKREDIEGDGVVGETPWIKPGESFTYTSFCPLSTATGNMRGTYQMQTEAGEKFKIKIPLFFLRDQCEPASEYVQ